MVCRLPLILAILALAGCAQTAVVKTWQPAQIDVAGLERIAVIDFAGENGSAVSAALTSRLWENKFYSLVDRSQFQPVLQTSYAGSADPDLNTVLTAARSADIDAVIVGEVVTCDCSDRDSQSTEFHFGQHRDEEAEKGKEAESHQSTTFGLTTNDVLTREGTVTIAFRLIDVETGEIRASKQVSRHFAGQSVNGDGPLPPRGEVLESLVDECVAETVQMLAPHETKCPMSLACANMFCGSRRGVKKGIELARSGDWAAAEQTWDEVLQQYPDNDAALFNLALAAAQRQDYEAAESRAMQALRLRHKEEYARGLEQIRSQRAAYQETERQREARVIPAMASAWK